MLSTPPAFVLSQDQTLHDRLFVLARFFLAYLLKFIAVSLFHETRTSAFFENVVIFFAVLFSFQRTIALSDLINIAYSLSSVKLFFQSSKSNALCIISVCFPFVKHFFCLYFYSFHFFLSHILQLVFLYFYTTIFCM